MTVFLHKKRVFTLSYKKPKFFKYSLHNLQLQLLNFFFIFFLKSVKYETPLLLTARITIVYV